MKEFHDLLREAQAIFDAHPCSRFADGTPLKNDVPVLMAEFAHSTKAPKNPEQPCTLCRGLEHDPDFDYCRACGSSTPKN